MSYRMQKVNSQIKREITKVIQQEIDDPRLEFVSITKVVTTPDLREAKVYFSVLKEEDTQDVTKILNDMRGYIRKLLGKRLRIKILPSLSFFFDDTIRYSVHIYKKIEEVLGDKENNRNNNQE